MSDIRESLEKVGRSLVLIKVRYADNSTMANPTTEGFANDALNALNSALTRLDELERDHEAIHPVPGTTPYVSTWLLERMVEHLDEHGVLEPSNLRDVLWSVAQELKGLRGLPGASGILGARESSDELG